MNILLINHYAGSAKHGMEYRPYYLAKEWVSKGHTVTIIASSFSHLRSTQPVIKKNIEEDNIDGIQYIWIRTNKYSGNSIFRIINMLSFTLKGIFYNRKIKKKYDKVIFTYPFEVFFANLLAKRNKAEFIFEIHDLWPLSFIELGGMSKYNPFVFLMQLCENFAYKKADKISTVLPNIREHVLSHGYSKLKKIYYIPNGINIKEWHKKVPIVSNDIQIKIDQLKKEKYKIILYAGTHGNANSLNTFIESASMMKNEKIFFLLIGSGPQKQKLMKEASNKNIKNIVFFNSIPKESLIPVLKQSDILYIGFKNISLYKHGIAANKIFDYMMAEKPIICAVNSSNDIISVAKSGLTIEPENAKILKDAIRKLINKKSDERKKIGLNGKKFVRKNHDYKILAQIYIKALYEVI
ncbi:MAG: glycosyltransferase family 4 protein [Spirochaetia bacterium]|nr:glycosyltransferase family 4 protein [Spirochaetia bacterium]